MTRDVEILKRDMDEFGYAIVEDALSDEQVGAVVARFMDQAQGEAEAMGLDLDVDGETSTARVFQVLNKGEEWRVMIDPTDEVHQVLEHVFDACFEPTLAQFSRDQKYLLSSTGAKFKHRDTLMTAPEFHIDQKWANGHLDYPIVCTVFYCLSDFTYENGATLVVPGSHKVPSPTWGQYPAEAPEMIAQAVAIEAPAGTAFIFEGRTWHAEGINTSGDIRIHLNGYHCAPYLRQRELFSMNLHQDVIDGLSDAQLKLLGFDSSLLYNLIEPTLGRNNVGAKNPPTSIQRAGARRALPSRVGTPEPGGATPAGGAPLTENTTLREWLDSPVGGPLLRQQFADFGLEESMLKTLEPIVGSSLAAFATMTRGKFTDAQVASLVQAASESATS